MKTLGKVIAVLLSLALTVILSFMVLTAGLVKPVMNTLKPEKVAAFVKTAMNTSVKKVLQAEKEGREIDPDDPVASIGGEIVNALKNAGVGEKTLSGLAESETLMNVVSELASTIALKSFKQETELRYPSKDEVAKIIREAPEAAQELMNTDVDLKGLQEAEIQEIVNKNYDKILKSIDGFVENMEGGK